MSLRLIVPQPTPIVEPVSVDAVKQRLRLLTTDDDMTISYNITAAREYAEKMTHRSLTAKAYTLALDRFPYPHEPIRIPSPPLSQILSITYLDNTLTQQTWASNEYFVAANQEPALVVPLPGTIYPDTARVPGSVTVDFIAGYGAPAVSGTPGSPATPDCPAHLAEAIGQLAVHIYSHPEAITSEGLREIPYALTGFFAANKVYVF